MRYFALVLLIACEGEPRAAEVTPEPVVAEQPPSAEQDSPPQAEAEPEPEPPPAPVVVAEPLIPPPDLRFPALEGEPSFSHEQIMAEISTARTRQFKPVGTTNIVFRVQMDSPHMAAYKPRSDQKERGYRAEIAAYRLSRLLGIDNVAPAISRVVAAREIRLRLHRRYQEAWLEIEEWTRWDAGGTTRGAAIYWIPEMIDPGLDQPESIREWSSWLRQGGQIPPEHRLLAQDLSNLVVFDYLIANWDRYSGGNLSSLPDRSRLVVRDHDAAFGTPLGSNIHGRLRRHLMRAEVFSADLVDRVFRLDEESLQAELGADPTHGDDPMMTPEQIADLMERRTTLLTYVGALVDSYGREAVLAFP